MRKNFFLIGILFSGLMSSQIYAPTTSVLSSTNAGVGIFTNAPNTNFDVNGHTYINVRNAHHTHFGIGHEANDNIISDNSPNMDYGGGYFFRVQNNSAQYAPYHYIDVMTLAENGSVGIGTMNPTEKLDVEGNTNISGIVKIGNVNIQPSCTDCGDYKLFVRDGIRTEQVKVDVSPSNGWADYVFKKEYKLRSLAEVEKYIAENGHLPEVPSEKHAIENGVELKAMNILLLKKIEELTLYTIEQEKRIEALEAKMEAFK